MSGGPNKRRDRRGDTFTVWDFANALSVSTATKNAVPKLPSSRMSKAKSKDFIGTFCLLEHRSPAPDQERFSKRLVAC